jgi:ribosomal protein S12 methylthiotransferase
MQQRRDQLMQIQQGISFRRNRDQVGKVVPVLLEQEHPLTGEFLGRSPRFAPDVDGIVHVIRGKGVDKMGSLGSLVPVLMTRAEPYDLFGEIVAAPADFDWHGRNLS